VDELTEAVAALRDRADNSDTFASFEGSTLVAVGEGDDFFPPQEAEHLAARARHGRFRVFAGASTCQASSNPASSTRRSRTSSPMSELPAVVDAAWLQAQLGEPDLVVGDVRGPNAHARGTSPARGRSCSARRRR
jgi:pimeloyl-ACP methyl ester carboxylesterase